MVNCIKWVGGKTKLSKSIIPLLNDYDIYIEPFLGSGAIGFNLLNDKNVDKIIILADKCWRLINFYYYVRNSIDELIQEINKLPYDNITQEIYTYLRKEFNNSTGIKSASLFLWINLTCYNGMYRENSKGEYNVPYGKKQEINIKTKIESILELNKLFKKYNQLYIVNCGYDELYQKYGEVENILWYLDPPYYNSFNEYISEKFDSKKFWDYTIKLKGKWIMSNSLDFKELINDEKYKVMDLKISYNIRPHSKTDDSKCKEILVISDN